MRTTARPSTPAPPALGILVAVYGVGALLTTLDATMVTVAVDSLQEELGAPLSVTQWVVTAPLLAIAASLPLAPWSINRFGARRVWMVGLVVFTVSSLVSGLAWNIESLIGTRVVGALAGGMLMPVGQTIVLRSAGREGLGRVLGLVNMPLLIGPIAGPGLGGLLLETFGWRSIFLVNLPLGIAAVWLTLRHVPRDAPGDPTHLDATGVLLLAPALAGMLYGVSRVQADPGDVPARFLLVAGTTLLGLFIWRCIRLGADALVVPRIFRSRGYRAGAGIAFLFNFVHLGGLVILALYFQRVLGMTPLMAGAVLGVQGVGSLLAMLVSGRTSDRVGARLVAAVGAVVATAATVAIALPGDSLPLAALVGLLLVRGLASSSMMLPAYAVAYSSVPSSDISHATTAMNLVSRIGGAYGVGVLVAVLDVAARGGDPATSFRTVLLVTAGVTALMLAVALSFPGRPRRTEAQTPATMSEPETREAG